MAGPFSQLWRGVAALTRRQPAAPAGIGHNGGPPIDANGGVAGGFGVPGGGVAGLEAGAGARRLRSFRPTAAHINTLIAGAGRTVTQRARWLVRNNAYAINAVDWIASAVIGPGITPSWLLEDRALKKALRAAWDAWTDEADAEGLTDFYGLQRRAMREIAIVGEVFFRLRYRRPEDGLLVPLQLQMLPSEMLDANDNRVLPGGNAVRQGIEFDRIGRRVAYHFYRAHPADSTEAQGYADQKVRVPADEVVHLMDPVEAGQLRGLSRFANVIVKMFSIDLYDDAEIERKKTAAMYGGFVTRKGREGDPTDPGFGPPPDAGALVQPAGSMDGVHEASLEPGTMQFLDDDEDVKFSEPADVGGNYEAFQFRTLLQIAVGLGVPYQGLTGDATRGNFGNTRSSSLSDRRRVEAFQWGVMVFGLCRPVVRAFVQQAALSGAVPGLTPEVYARTPRAFTRARWMPPPWGWVDPKKDIEANVLEVKEGFKARSDVMEANGYDAEETDERRAEDQKRERRLGLVKPPAAATPPAPPTQEEDPEDPDDPDAKPKKAEE
ncbi:phage portal protein [Roseomonas sp. F4]